MKRFTAAQLIEAAAFVVVTGLPMAAAEVLAALPWWLVLFSRIFNAGLNTWILLYCDQLGAWFCSRSVRLIGGVGKHRSAVALLTAILIMGLPVYALGLWLLSRLTNAAAPATSTALVIQMAGCVGMWLYKFWVCPLLEQHLPWLARLARDPVGTARGAARSIASLVSGGSKSQ